MKFKILNGDFPQNSNLGKILKYVDLSWGLGTGRQLRLNGLMQSVDILSSDNKGNHILKCQLRDGRSFTAEADMDCYKTLLTTMQPVEPPKQMTKNQKVLLGIFLGLFAFLMIFGALGSIDSQSGNSSGSETTQAASVDMSKLSEESVTQIVQDQMGDLNRDDVDRIQDISVLPAQSGGYDVSVTFAADDNFGNNMIKVGILDNIKKVAQQLRDKYPDISYLKMVATFSMKDVYGKVTEDPVLRVEYSRATLDKMQFDNMLTDDVLNAADTQWVHPGFLK